ncbi:MAG: delta-aminolevulinic acid dehydratase [Acidobacteria bacterium]|nr:delta-aminolevulinic acid dehydratase [Acidobacteriota bacterium]
MEIDYPKIYDALFAYCEAEDFAGYDPFDGLNSRLFRALPLKHLAPARLAWLQLVKRSAKNLRPALKIEKGVNAKGLALFALAELARFRTTGDESHAVKAKSLLEKLQTFKIEIRNPKSEIRNRTAFGYNFDWQSRAFFAPEGTPTVVPTAFAAQALLEGFAAFGKPEYLGTAREICAFVTEDLNRTGESADEVCFSYTPLDKSVIFNASLLAAECLAGVGALDANDEYLRLAEKAAHYVVRRQKENGAWAYGAKLRHAWVDNFHTAYILLSLYRLQKLVPGLDCRETLRTGLDYWLAHFFLDDGTPKYYDQETYPIDIHSASAAIVALGELAEFDARCLPLADRVAGWTVANMRDPKGFFYYQKRPNGLVKTSFIRWANAWTAFALARLIETKAGKDGEGKNF